MKKVAVIMGSDSDFPVMKNAVRALKEKGLPVEVHVLSAHRTPKQAGEFAASARENGFGVIIAAAGKAAHLAGVLAGHTTLPVIGVPMKASVLDGMDALLATVQMPKGVPVATVAIDGADNADFGCFRSGIGGQAGSGKTGNGPTGVGKGSKAAGRNQSTVKMPKGSFDYYKMEEMTDEKTGTAVRGKSQKSV